MHRFKRTKRRAGNRPAIGLPLKDAETAHDEGGEAVQSKKMPRSSLAELIERKTWENDQLRRELEQEREKYRVSYRAGIYLAEEAGQVVNSLQKALQNFEQMSKEVEEELVHR